MTLQIPQNFFLELTNYTSPKFGWQTRMSAFQYLSNLGINNNGLKNLVKASVHHSWQFRKYARGLIDQLLTDTDYKIRLQKIKERTKR